MDSVCTAGGQRWWVRAATKWIEQKEIRQRKRNRDDWQTAWFIIISTIIKTCCWPACLLCECGDQCTTHLEELQNLMWTASTRRRNTAVRAGRLWISHLKCSRTIWYVYTQAKAIESLSAASYVSWQRDTARICCAAVHPRLLQKSINIAC